MAARYVDDDGMPMSYDRAMEELEYLTINDVVEGYSENAYEILGLLPGPVVQDVMEGIRDAARNDEGLLCKLLNIKVAGGME